MKKSSIIQGDLNGLLSKYLILQRQNAAKPHLQGKKNILDLGCGVFRWGNLIEKNVHYTGIDTESDIVAFNNEHFPQHSFFQKNIDQEDLQFPQDSFDLIIMLAVLEHLENPVKVLRGIKDILTDNGTIVLSTPHPRGENILEIGSIFRIFSQDKHQHQPLIDKKKMTEIAHQSELDIVEFQSFLFGFNQRVVLRKGISNE